jgi:hypothetical protein
MEGLMPEAMENQEVEKEYEYADIMSNWSTLDMAVEKFVLNNFDWQPCHDNNFKLEVIKLAKQDLNGSIVPLYEREDFDNDTGRYVSGFAVMSFNEGKWEQLTFVTPYSNTEDDPGRVSYANIEELLEEVSQNGGINKIELTDISNDGLFYGLTNPILRFHNPYGMKELLGDEFYRNEYDCWEDTIPNGWEKYIHVEQISPELSGQGGNQLRLPSPVLTSQDVITMLEEIEKQGIQFPRNINEMSEILLNNPEARISEILKIPYKGSDLVISPDTLQEALNEVFPQHTWTISGDGDSSLLEGAYQISSNSTETLSEGEKILVNAKVMNRMFPIINNTTGNFVGFVGIGDREHPNRFFFTNGSFQNLASLNRSMVDFDSSNNPKLVNFAKYTEQNPDLDIAIVFGDGNDSENLFNLGTDGFQDFILIPPGYDSIHDLLQENLKGIDLKGNSLSDVSRAMVRHPQILNWISTFPSGTLISKTEINAAIKTALGSAENT